MKQIILGRRPINSTNLVGANFSRKQRSARWNSELFQGLIVHLRGKSARSCGQGFACNPVQKSSCKGNQPSLRRFSAVFLAKSLRNLRNLWVYALIATLLALPFGAGATGMFECEAVAEADWMSEAEITAALASKGWQVNRMKKDGGCWEVYGITPDGQRAETYLHPATGEVQLINQRGRILFDIRNQYDPSGHP